MGFSLELPTIERDPQYSSKLVYRLRGLGDDQRLVRVTGDGTAVAEVTQYRPELDTSFMRVTERSHAWTVRTPDGMTRFFEASTLASDLATRWNLTRERDAFGNEVVYTWSRYTSAQGYVDFTLQKIEYTSNPAAGLGPHARVELSYYGAIVTCTGSAVPAGARTDHHFGLKRQYGTRTLNEVVTWVRDSQSSTTWNKVMVHKLTYDPNTLSCSGAAAPLRYLTQLDVTAYAPDGTVTAAPPVKLGYGPTTRSLSATQVAPIGHGDYGDRYGAAGSLMDMNGDGLNDRVWVDLNPTNKRCRLNYRPGRRAGWFENQTVSTDLPTARWEYGADGPGVREYCSLNGQRFKRGTTGSNLAGACAFHGGFVSYHFLDLDGDGGVDFLTNIWADAESDVLGDFADDTSLVAANSNDDPGNTPCGGVSCPSGMETGGCSEGTGEGGTDELSCSCPAGTEAVDMEHCCPPGQAWGPNGCVDPNACDSFTCPPPGGPEGPGRPGGFGNSCREPDLQPEVEQGGFVWRVHHNDGGTLRNLDLLRPAKVHSPRPLPPSSNELTLDSYAKPTLQTLADIDGDGVLDVVALPGDPRPHHKDPTKPLGEATTLEVWRGFESGGDYDVSTIKQSWPLPAPFFVMLSGTQEDNGTPGVAHVATWSAAVLSDLNGDGLPDLVIAKDIGSLYVAWNQQGSFGPLTALGATGPITRTQSDLTDGWTSSDQLTNGRSGTWKRLVDIDADGLPDIVTLARTDANVGSTTGVRTVARNVGDRLVAGTAPTAMWDATKGVVVVSQGNWYRTGDLVDLTGDGLPDLVSWAANGDATVRTDDPVSSCAPNSLCTPTLPTTTMSGAPASLAGDFNGATEGATELFAEHPGVAPPTRLLASIENGRGGIVRLRYAPSTDTQVVGLEGKVLPSPHWVVAAVSVEPGFGQPTMRTNYRYFAPVTGTSSPSDPSPPHFLGFARVEITRPRQDGTGVGSRVVRELDYSIDQDHSGRLVHEQTFLGGVATPITDRQLTWRNVGVLGAVSFSYREQELARTCRPGQALASCKLLRTTDTWTPYLLATGKAGLYLHERTAQGPGAALALNDRSTRFTYQVRVGQAPYPATDYRVLETLRERQHASPFANGPGFGGPFGTSGRTVTLYNTAGLPYRTEVSLTASVTAVTARTFDAQTGNLLTTKRPNQVALNTFRVTSQQYDSHRLYVIRTVNELGHKVLTTTDIGTGVVVKREGPNSRTVPCAAPCTPTRVLAPETWRIDGFGRAIEHRVAADVALGNGYSLPLVERTTIVETERPNRRRIERLRDAGGTVWVTADDRFDGTGRVLSHTELLQTPGRPDAVTRYTYDTLGKLAAVSSPDPRDDAKVVVHRYSRDGLGRVTALVRPDGSSVMVKYLGLDVDSQTNDPNGPIGEHNLAKYDVYGQLLELQEYDNPAADRIASTSYAYDPAGRIRSVTDADGVVTTMTHDWADRRTMIQRGIRAWTYGYDFDGNVTSEGSPLPARASARDPDFRSSTTYDPLDRPLTHTPASRGLTAARRTELKIGPTTKVYDGADNGVGQLERVMLPFGSVTYRYDVHGRVAREERTFSTTYLAQANATQWVERAYNLLGQPTQVSWDDGTRWNVAYDVRGLPAAVNWAKPGERVPPTLATYERSLAGAPRVRRSTYDQQRTWTYDALGRVATDRVFQPSTNRSSWSERTYGYDGLGELRIVNGQTNGVSAKATYEYDSRHRLLGAEGPSNYLATFAYKAGGNVARAKVTGSDQPDRDVSYHYGDVDPQAVDRLMPAGGGAALADMIYDPAGNLINKRAPAGTFKFVWDGDNQLREAETPSGREAYYYDHNGQRVLAMTQSGVRFWFGESETRYSSTGVVQERLLHIGLGEPIARIKDGNSVELQYADALQNLMLSLSPDGTVRGSFLYGGFGEVVASLGDADHRRQFNGKENDVSTGWRYYGFRSYDPLLLRWTSSDPLYRFAPDWRKDDPQRANLYAFIGNNPLRYYDPDGREPEDELNDPLKPTTPGREVAYGLVKIFSPDKSSLADFALWALYLPSQNDPVATQILGIGYDIVAGPVIVIASINIGVAKKLGTGTYQIVKGTFRAAGESLGEAAAALYLWVIDEPSVEDLENRRIDKELDRQNTAFLVEALREERIREAERQRQERQRHMRWTRTPDGTWQVAP